MISIAACGLSLFIGFVIGISFFSFCRNELELEIAMHQRTMDALIKLQKQVNIDNESKNVSDAEGLNQKMNSEAGKSTGENGASHAKKHQLDK